MTFIKFTTILIIVYLINPPAVSAVLSHFHVLGLNLCLNFLSEMEWSRSRKWLEKKRLK